MSFEDPPITSWVQGMCRSIPCPRLSLGEAGRLGKSSQPWPRSAHGFKERGDMVWPSLRGGGLESFGCGRPGDPVVSGQPGKLHRNVSPM